ISAASAEQYSGIEQINQAITHMDQATQQNAALVEEAAAGTEELSAQAATLAEVVDGFRMQGSVSKAAAPLRSLDKAAPAMR
ncbi:partial Methyl-accepting chemotaxis protein III, partial [Burkholderiales bacterium]